MLGAVVDLLSACPALSYATGDYVCICLRNTPLYYTCVMCHRRAGGGVPYAIVDSPQILSRSKQGGMAYRYDHFACSLCNRPYISNKEENRARKDLRLFFRQAIWRGATRSSARVSHEGAGCSSRTALSEGVGKLRLVLSLLAWKAGQPPRANDY